MNPADVTTPLLSVKDVAERLAVCESLVRGWIADGSLPCYRLGRKGSRGKICVAVSDLEAFLNRQKTKEPEPAKASTFHINSSSQASPFSELNLDRLSKAWKRKR
jgi:excisionase family DNA binding protein